MSQKRCCTAKSIAVAVTTPSQRLSCAAFVFRVGRMTSAWVSPRPFAKICVGTRKTPIHFSCSMSCTKASSVPYLHIWKQFEDRFTPDCLRRQQKHCFGHLSAWVWNRKLQNQCLRLYFLQLRRKIWHLACLMTLLSSFVVFNCSGSSCFTLIHKFGHNIHTVTVIDFAGDKWTFPPALPASCR